jgi:translation initiation factor 1
MRMGRGTKLDLFIGADIQDGWSEVEEKKPVKKSHDIQEPSKHFLLFKKEKRRGKTVTLVGEFFLELSQANTLLKKLKKKLGCGGKYADGWMEFQGELKEKLRELLLAEEFKFRKGH